MRILAETAYPPIAPSPRVRVQSFVPYLAEHGIEALYQPALTNGEYQTISAAGHPLGKAALIARCGVRLALRPNPPHDGLWVHRLGFLTPLPGIEPRRHSDIYDLDDALFLGSISKENRRFALAKREAQRCVAYLRSAGLVTVGNHYLADRAREHAGWVEIVPSCVDCSRQRPREHADHPIVTVGWIGSRTTSGYLHEVLPVFDRLNADRLRAKLLLVGADLPLRAPWLEQRPWSLSRQYEDVAEFDIGIMPLADDDWARGKCSYKLLQYFAAGVPAIASPVGLNTDLVGTERGHLARTSRDWEDALVELARDAAARREIGANARRFAEDQYSYTRWAPILAELLRSALTGGSPRRRRSGRSR